VLISNCSIFELFILHTPHIIVVDGRRIDAQPHVQGGERSHDRVQTYILSFLDLENRLSREARFPGQFSLGELTLFPFSLKAGAELGGND
jgi:hypothetical protein